MPLQLLTEKSLPMMLVPNLQIWQSDDPGSNQYPKPFLKFNSLNVITKVDVDIVNMDLIGD